MNKISQINATMVPLDRANIDTDAIIPKQFLKSIKRSGFGVFLFDEWRYLDQGYIGMDCSKRKINKNFILNQSPFNKASVLVTRENFGCGSSREHAPWALLDYGFQAVIASSYADIFYNNSIKNALLPVVLDAKEVDVIFEMINKNPLTNINIDLEKQTVTLDNNVVYYFEIDSFQKNCMLNGLDEIGLTLQKTDKIKAFEERYYSVNSWLN